MLISRFRHVKLEVNELKVRSYSSIKSEASEKKQQVSSQNAAHATIVGSVVNIGLAGAKGLTGISIGSTALIADCINSMGDLVSDSIVYFSVTRSRQGLSSDRPWGQGKLEPLGMILHMKGVNDSVMF